MKRTGRIPRALRGGLRWAVACGWAWAAGALAAPPSGAAADSSARVEPAEARARLVELDRALGQARANRDKAMDDLVAVWRQLMASRAELEQIRRQMDENARAVARARESERKLKLKTDEWEAARQTADRLRA